ncbi:hypothetical protein BST81_20315 [Leptolyngbya sp. 'hensonii']|uniref:hypothetical protein n=1 Tax=Leptolyngbya sp. 'hensonii' TaxID=1922337 RepID=UPI0009502B4E|nr:hypothetical protein [Leptolyngbya sp. 'hensonii']OLP16547.1 hypothetical protein BST81_20315 [Leptolyngbya sp. 'hensonii']
MVSFAKTLSAGVLGTAIAAMGTLLAAPSHATTLTGFQTFGDDMDGMEVTVKFLGGGSETKIWGDTGPGAGGAFGTGWSLVQSGDTFSSPWTLSYGGSGSITSLLINAIPGNTVFDLSEPSPGTPGSANGRTFDVQSGQAPTSSNYSVPIDISVGDLFGQLTLQWANGFKGDLSFLADTDSGTTDDPVDPKPVPESAALLGLLAIGALGAGSRLRWQRG